MVRPSWSIISSCIRSEKEPNCRFFARPNCSRSHWFWSFNSSYSAREMATISALLAALFFSFFMRKLYHEKCEKASVFKLFIALYCTQSSYGFRRLWLFCFQPLHKPAVLLRRQHPDFILRSRPLETATFQTFVQQKKAVSLPVQGLDTVSFSAAEQEQRRLKGIHLELCAYHAGQTVDPTPQIRITTGNVHRTAAIEIVQHSFKIRSTASTVVGSAPLWTSATTPSARTVIATGVASRTSMTGVTSAN